MQEQNRPQNPEALQETISWEDVQTYLISGIGSVLRPIHFIQARAAQKAHELGQDEDIKTDQVRDNHQNAQEWLEEKLQGKGIVTLGSLQLENLSPSLRDQVIEIVTRVIANRPIPDKPTDRVQSDIQAAIKIHFLQKELRELFW